MSRHLELGQEGENEAVRYLTEKGYTVLERNYRYGRAEVDIIAQTGKTVVFAEVKTRTSYLFGFPEEAVSRQKQHLMAMAASNYLFEHALNGELRFDVIAIFKSKDGKWHIKHFEDAFFIYE